MLYVISEEYFKVGVIKLMVESVEFNYLPPDQIAAMAREVVARAVKAGVPFGKAVTRDELLEIVTRMCSEVTVSVQPDSDEQWLELLTWEPAYI